MIDEPIMWSALGLWGIKSLYEAINNRTKKSDDGVRGHDVRLAVLQERVDRLVEKVAVLERNESSQWRAIDKCGADDNKLERS